MKVAVVPGYGDATRYLERLTKPWLKQGHEVIIHPYGTINDRTDEENWKRFTAILEPGIGLVGVSFGLSVVARALQDYPEVVCAAVGVSGPHSLDGLNLQTVRTKYPKLADSLEKLDADSIDSARIETYAPLADGVIPPHLVPIDGARHHRVLAVGHPMGIGAAFLLHRQTMLNFLTEQHAQMIARK